MTETRKKNRTGKDIKNRKARGAEFQKVINMIKKLQ